ncbi:MAG: MauE/DoxX family redox-associated membrane protein [Thermomicrobiales bacterium]
MDTLLLLARLVLAGVFVVAGVAKLADRQGSKKALEGFGVPAGLSSIGGSLLPIVELIVGVLLIPRASAPYAAVAALVLLLAFIAGIVYNMARGRAPDCHCFGQIHSEPVGMSTLVRNGVLALVALFVIVGGWSDPGPSVIAWIGDLSTSEQIFGLIAVLALAGVAIEGWMIVHLVSQNGRVLLRLDSLETMLAAQSGQQPASAATPPRPVVGLPVGTLAPAFELPNLNGETVSLDALRAAGRPVLLVLSDPHCGPCNALLPEIGRWERDHRERLTVAVISRGDPDANRAKASERTLGHVLLQNDREVAHSFGTTGTPSGVIVTPDGKIGSETASGADAIRQLVSKTTGAAPPPPSTNGAAAMPAKPAAGDVAPAIELPDLEGKTVRLTDYKERETLVLFWNPGCGFCSRMLPELKDWLAARPSDAPELLIVSRGQADENREQGIDAPILLDQGFSAGRSFGATGTPAAVLVSAEGLVASPVVAGAAAVMTLARGGSTAQAATSSQPAQGGNG